MLAIIARKPVAGLELLQFCQGVLLHFPLPVRCSFYRLIVNHHDLPVPGRVHVEFHVSDADFYGTTKCRHGILRRFATRTAVSKESRFWPGEEVGHTPVPVLAMPSSVAEAAGSGPAATSFFRLGSTVRFSPSRVLAPRSSKSPFSANTPSSIVKNLSKRMMAKPTLRVTCCPLAITNSTPFFSFL